MKKMLKNKKGFTLIELLAVIVVLAIIMVIATQQVNATIVKARTNSYIETMEMVVRTAKLIMADPNSGGSFDDASLNTNLDYDSSEYTINVTNGVITLTPGANSKFSNSDFDKVSCPTKFHCENSSKKICAKVAADGTVSAPTTCN